MIKIKTSLFVYTKGKGILAIIEKCERVIEFGRTIINRSQKGKIKRLTWQQHNIHYWVTS